MTGTGTKSDPYIIESSSDFIETYTQTGVYIKLANDISLEITETLDMKCEEIDGNMKSISMTAPNRGQNLSLLYASAQISIKNAILGIVCALAPAPIFNASSSALLEFENCIINLQMSGTFTTPIIQKSKFSNCEILTSGITISSGAPLIYSQTNITNSAIIISNSSISVSSWNALDMSEGTVYNNCYIAFDPSVSGNVSSMSAPTTSNVAVWATDFNISFTANGWEKCSISSIKSSDYVSAIGLTGFKINSEINNGYPYIVTRDVPHPDPPPDPEPSTIGRLYNQICLYAVDTAQTGFDNNGIAVLCPSSCVAREKLNGEYSLTMEHPIDEDGIWRTISAFTHIKALGQIFDVKTVTHDYTGRSGKINVYAEHVFYKMNDPWIFPESVISGSTLNELIQSAMTAADAVPFPGSVDYAFNYDSDIPVTAGYSRTIDKGCTLAEAIIGSGGIQETFGGELYRNNFYFSLKQRMEGSLDNAFEIRVGLNMKGIKRTVDVETFCSYFRAYDHLGQWFAISYDASAYSGLPIQNSVVRSQNFSYDTDDPDVSMANLEREADFYWWKHLAPKITYEVDLRDTRNNPDFSFISNPYRFKVGDYGRIYDDRLGGALKLRITETETDALTGEVTKVVFGDLRGFVKESGYLPIPEFPVIPIWEIAAKPLNGGKTTYFDSFQDTKSFLNENPDTNYRIIISENTKFLSIPTDAFYLCGNIVSVDIPWRITSIGRYAFGGCKKLEDVNIPYNLSYIAPYAFSDCESLTDLFFQANSRIESISDGCFQGCSGLTNITIPNHIKTIGALSFDNCENIAQVNFEQNSILTNIGNMAFENCMALKSITIPSSVETIGSYVFAADAGHGSISSMELITINKQQGSISGAPWGAANATVVWTG